MAMQRQQDKVHDNVLSIPFSVSAAIVQGTPLACRQVFHMTFYDCPAYSYQQSSIWQCVSLPLKIT